MDRRTNLARDEDDENWRGEIKRLRHDQLLKHYQQGGTPQPQRFVRVGPATILPHLSDDGEECGALIKIRVTADNDDQLHGFFRVRAGVFRREVESAVRMAGAGRVKLARIEHHRGSLELVMLVVIVVANYPDLKQNVPIIWEDAVEVAKWIQSDVLPAIEGRVHEFFEDYVINPVARLLKDTWRAFFGWAST